MSPEDEDAAKALRRERLIAAWDVEHEGDEPRVVVRSTVFKPATGWACLACGASGEIDGRTCTACGGRGLK